MNVFDRMNAFEKMFSGLLLIVTVAVWSYLFTNQGIVHAERSAGIEYKVISCDMGQIPLDCIENPKQRSAKPSKQKNYVP